MIRNFLLTALLIATLAISALPLTGASAASPADTATPPAPKDNTHPATLNARLELAFAREQVLVKRIGLASTRSEAFIGKVQKMIDKAREESKDTTALQSSLNSFKSAMVKAKPFYTQAASIAAAHTGFDAAGKVTDAAQARATLQSLKTALQQHREAIGDTFKNLRAAIQAFRAANPKATIEPLAP